MDREVTFTRLQKTTRPFFIVYIGLVLLLVFIDWTQKIIENMSSHHHPPTIKTHRTRSMSRKNSKTRNTRETSSAYTPRKRGPHKIDDDAAKFLRSSGVGEKSKSIDTVVSGGDAASRAPLRRGWLRKTYTRMGRRVGWHDRYFVCGNRIVQYFKKANNTVKPRGEILLGVGCSVAFDGKMDAGTHRFPFTIVFDDEGIPKLCMAADRLEDAEEWVKTIRGNIASALVFESEEQSSLSDTSTSTSETDHNRHRGATGGRGRLASYSVCHSDEDEDDNDEDEDEDEDEADDDI